MYAQAASNACVKNGLVGLAICGGHSRHGTSPLVAISSGERKAPGENLFAEGDERNDVCLRCTWDGMGTIITSHVAQNYGETSTQICHSEHCGLLPRCGGVRGTDDDYAQTKSGYATLGKGPAFQLGRAAPGEDEDCVRVTRRVGPDGRVYVTRGLICEE